MNSHKKKPRRSKKRAHKAEITDDDEILTRPPIPPDGGWGYVVMMSSFMISFLLDGVCFSFGIFFNDFMDYFQTSKGKTSWVGSALNGTYLFIGPVVSGLANRYGCRNVTIIGSIIAATALFLSTFSPSIEVLIFLYGIVGGIGFGLVYLPAIVMVGYYFEKKRALATGVAVCGSGIGAFAFAPICERLLHEYDWKGALWIISGLVLNGVVCAAFYRPLKPEIIRKKDLSAYEAQLLGVKQNPIYKPGCEPKKDNVKLLKQSQAQNIPDIVVASSEARDILDDLRPGRPPSKTKFLAFSDEYLSISPRSSSVSVTKRSKYSQSIEPGSGNPARLAKSQDVATLCKLQPEQYQFLDINDMARPLYRKDIFYSGSIMHLPEYHVVQDDMAKYITSVTRIPIDEPSRACCRVPRACKSIFYDMIDVTLLKSVTFVIYGLSCTLVMLGFFVPFTYVPPLAISMGFERQRAAFLVSILGITNTLGRVISGLLSDRPWADCLLINNVTLIISGIITMMAPLYTSYGLLATYCTLFGLFISAFVSLRSVIVVDLLGLDKLTNAFGLITLCQGISAFIGSPIAGTLADTTGNYDAAFYLAGASLILAGVVCLPLRRISAWEKARAVGNDVREDENDVVVTMAPSPVLSPENIPMINVELA